MLKPKTQPAELDEDLEDDDADEGGYDDEQPLFDPEESGR